MSRYIRNISLLLVCAIPGLAWVDLGIQTVAAEQANANGGGQQCQTADADRPADAAKPITPSAAGAIGRGDRVSLSFYEELQTQDDKWGNDRQRLQEPSKGFQMHAELTGEYLVHEDGSILVPLLGAFSIEGMRAVEVQKQLKCRFEAVIGRKGFANVVNVIKQPIYVIGKVKNSGAFDYMPGMTVLHAIALAGGFDKAQMEPYQIAELTRQSETLQLALDRAMRMIARTTAIDAARATDPALVPVELAELAGAKDAQYMVAEELAPQRLEVQALATEEKAFKATVDSAATELEVRKARLPLLQKSLELRGDRVAMLTGLNQKGILGRPVLIQAQTELLDVEDKRQETVTTIAVAEDKLAKAKQDLKKQQMQVVLGHQKDLLTTQTEASKAAHEADSAANIVRVITRTQLAAAAALEVEYQIIRRTSSGALVIPATETTQLEPGDLVQAKPRNAPSLTTNINFGRNR